MTTAEELQQSAPDEFHLACLLLSPSGSTYLAHALDAVGPADFFDTHYGRLWEVARSIHAAGGRITKRSLLAEVDNPAARIRLDRVSGEPVYTEKIQASINAVIGTAKMRRLVQALNGALSSVSTAEDYGRALEIAHAALNKLDEADAPTEVIPFSQLVDDFRKAQAGGLEMGEVVPTPWRELDEVLSGGFHPKKVFVVAGRLGEGKSIAGGMAAQHSAEQGFPTLVVSAEMPGLELAGRMMAAGARVEYGEITRFAMTANSQARVDVYCAQHRDMPLWVVDKTGMPVEAVAAVARSVKRKHGLALLMVDYLQLVEATDKRVPREQQVSHISKALHGVARELECAVVVLAQLNREGVKSNRKPLPSDLRESDAIGQDADCVILLYHPQTDEGDPTGMVNFIVGKNRFGPKTEIELRWRGHQARIGDSWAA